MVKTALNSKAGIAKSDVGSSDILNGESLVVELLESVFSRIRSLDIASETLMRVSCRTRKIGRWGCIQRTDRFEGR